MDSFFIFYCYYNHSFYENQSLRILPVNQVCICSLPCESLVCQTIKALNAEIKSIMVSIKKKALVLEIERCTFICKQRCVWVLMIWTHLSPKGIEKETLLTCICSHIEIHQTEFWWHRNWSTLTRTLRGNTNFTYFRQNQNTHFP